MTKVNSMNVLVGLFFALVLIIALQPRLLTKIYSSVLGRFFLILVVLFFAMNNVTLGLLTALIVVIASSMHLREGLDTMDTDTTIDTTTDTNRVNYLGGAAKAKVLQEKRDANATSGTDTTSSADTTTDGIDLETIKNSIQAQSSNSLPVSSTSNEEVAPASTEPFQTMYAPF